MRQRPVAHPIMRRRAALLMNPFKQILVILFDFKFFHFNRAMSRFNRALSRFNRALSHTAINTLALTRLAFSAFSF